MIKSIIERKTIVISSIIIILFLVFIWPTPYKYDHISRGNTKYPVKINRLSGKTWILKIEGWELLEKKTTKPASEWEELPEAAKLNVEISYDLSRSYSTAAHLTCYNGSNWEIKEITLSVTKARIGSEGVLDKYMSLEKQVFENRLYCFQLVSGDGKQYSISQFYANVGFYIEKTDLITYDIVSIKGMRSN